MAVRLDQPLRRSPAVAERVVADETVLVPIRTRPDDKVSVLLLNEVGSFVWASLATPTTPAALIQAMTTEFEVSAEQAARDLGPFIERLCALGLAAAA